MKHARLLSLSLLVLLGTSSMIAMEQGESSQTPQKTKKRQKRQKKLTPEEEKQQVLDILNLTLITIKLAETRMNHSAMTLHAMLPQKTNNNNNAQQTATPAAPVATASDDSSSNNQAPEKPFTVQDLLAQHETMDQALEKTSALVTTGIAQLCNEFNSNTNNDNSDEE